MLPSFCLPLIEKQPFCSPATSTATALGSITDTKMSHCTFPSEVSPIYFYAYPSSPSATRYFFPFNSCLAYFMPSGRAIPAMHLSTASNSRGVLCPKLPPSAGTSDCQHKVLQSSFCFTDLQQLQSSGSLSFPWGIICHLTDLTLIFIIVPYCKTLPDSGVCPHHPWQSSPICHAINATKPAPFSNLSSKLVIKWDRKPNSHTLSHPR